MTSNRIPGPGWVPFGTCPRCLSPDPPVVTVVTFSMLYFTCTRCGFDWSVLRTYVPPVEEA
jgi:transposase-like protein